MSRNNPRQYIVAAIALTAGGLCVGLNLTRRAGENIGALVIRTFAAVEDKRFLTDMSRYDEKCGRLFRIYASSDMETGRKALGQIIDLSLAEKSKATSYWNFNVELAFSLARLAVMAEAQGKREEAGRLFASASEYMVLQNRAINRAQGFQGYSDDEARYTPVRWRMLIAALDKHANVQWMKPPEATPGSVTPPDGAGVAPGGGVASQP
jgi:hypothetical protein